MGADLVTPSVSLSHTRCARLVPRVGDSSGAQAMRAAHTFNVKKNKMLKFYFIPIV